MGGHLSRAYEQCARKKLALAASAASCGSVLGGASVGDAQPPKPELVRASRFARKRARRVERRSRHRAGRSPKRDPPPPQCAVADAGSFDRVAVAALGFAYRLCQSRFAS
ncbi:hypothetical protein MRX96_053022 [Rhipicephalus microplus]